MNYRSELQECEKSYDGTKEDVINNTCGDHKRLHERAGRKPEFLLNE